MASAMAFSKLAGRPEAVGMVVVEVVVPVGVDAEEVDEGVAGEGSAGDAGSWVSWRLA